MPRMPANNRMHTGAALQTHGIWADTIGYDPYAPTATGAGEAPAPETLPIAPSPYEKAQGLLALARLTGSGTANSRGTCNKCGGVGHLTFQCRNTLKLNPNDVDVSSTESDTSGSDDDSSGESEVERKEAPVELEQQRKDVRHLRRSRSRSPPGKRKTSSKHHGEENAPIRPHEKERGKRKRSHSSSTSPSSSRKRRHSKKRKEKTPKRREKKKEKREKKKDKADRKRRHKDHGAKPSK